MGGSIGMAPLKTNGVILPIEEEQSARIAALEAALRDLTERSKYNHDTGRPNHDYALCKLCEAIRIAEDVLNGKP